ncbi:group II intron maturase-specific domain-containing protein [Planctomicrobium sp. SH527]|uniref:group II intron maturase-specific domain-containing protein n=1 Tax=Planctomicrobium sp. SH527 TaxID=3448123 RepID=UPI003F5C7B05
MRQLMLRLKLTVNEDKTRLCRLPGEGFDFLGYTIQRRYSHRTGGSYIGPAPSKQKVAGLIAAISEATSRRWTLMGMPDRIRHLNRMLTGWANYFCLGDTVHVYQAINRHTIRRVRYWYGRKHQARSGVRKELPSGRLHGELALVRLRARKTQIPWAEKS